MKIRKKMAGTIAMIMALSLGYNACLLYTSTIQMQEEQKCSSCFLTELQQLAGKGDSMAKFLNYEDRLEIESGLKEHMTFTELGEKDVYKRQW